MSLARYRYFLKRRTLRSIRVADKALRVARTTILVRRDRRLPVAAVRLAEQLVEVARALGRIPDL